MMSILWMMGALCSFCLIAIGARELSGDITTAQLMALRSIIGLGIISAIILYYQDKRLFQTQRLRLHVFRNVFHFAGQYGWLLGLTLLPLAEVFAIEFTVPIWTAIIATLFLNERFTSKRLFSLVLGFIGVLIIVQPGIKIINSASLIVLGAAMCYAVSHASTKLLSTSDKPLTILFFMCLVQLPFGLILAYQGWQSPNIFAWGWIVLVSVSALLAHFCMTKAMQFADVTLVVMMDFLRLPLIAIVGFYVYEEGIDWTLFLGASFMLVGNLMNVSSPRKEMVNS
ncbi:EamA family transporter [Photobacterium sp. GB-50]|uniref:DMT family transporter n=1 Tax=unclassified Photobacterium TaxID=2628852 RepID=UPI000D179121|nr:MULTISPECIES: DMT family transporter [unclassified Photobacterium]PSV54407.1 EamA family transporter [Photobacterium sp. GB-3]PSW74553.1 EamA family transporter [Photobacterium sp. GB-50]